MELIINLMGRGNCAGNLAAHNLSITLSKPMHVCFDGRSWYADACGCFVGVEEHNAANREVVQRGYTEGDSPVEHSHPLQKPATRAENATGFLRPA